MEKKQREKNKKFKSIHRVTSTHQYIAHASSIKNYDLHKASTAMINIYRNDLEQNKWHTGELPST